MYLKHIRARNYRAFGDGTTAPELIDPAGFIHEPLRAEVAQALGKLRDNAIDTLE